MSVASPLRYPGGKAAMTDLLSSIRRLNGLGAHSVAEPFAGGAGAALSLLYREDCREILINDADQAIHDFWWTVTNRPRPFLAMIETTNVTMAEWRKQRDIYRRKNGVSRLRRAFAAFFLNRCNRSGIIMNGGPIGGIDQRGKWKLDARFNKSRLAKRCAKVAEYGSRIQVSQQDAIAFIGHHAGNGTFFFIDPPYYEKSQTLYLNTLDHAYHLQLAKQLHSMDQMPWVVTYDDCPEICAMYEGWANIRPFSLRYAAAERRRGKEVLITPQWMELPGEQGSSAIGW